MKNKRIKYQLTLILKGDAFVDAEDTLPDEQILSAVIGEDSWRDGRYDYSHELMVDGINRRVQLAIREAIYESFRKEIGELKMHNTLSECGKVRTCQPLYRKLADEYMKNSLPYLALKLDGMEAEFKYTDTSELEQTYDT